MNEGRRLCPRECNESEAGTEPGLTKTKAGLRKSQSVESGFMNVNVDM